MLKAKFYSSLQSSFTSFIIAHLGGNDALLSWILSDSLCYLYTPIDSTFSRGFLRYHEEACIALVYLLPEISAKSSLQHL